jgi:fructokinase
MRARRVVVSVDINIRLGASVDNSAYLEGVRSILEFADIVKASDEDLAALQFDLSPDKSEEAAFAAMKSGILVVTKGRAGALLLSEQGRIKRDAYPVARVADTVGAGDSFHSAFLAALLRTGQLDNSFGRISLESLGDAVDFACAAAAICVSRNGCSPPTKPEVDRFLATANRLAGISKTGRGTV